MDSDSNQAYDLLVRGGRLIDPSQGMDGQYDVAVTNGMVTAVGPNLPTAQAGRIIDAAGRIVTPGWIDLHVHVYWGVSHYGIEPDISCLNWGVTTAVDLGSAGARTFPAFRRLILDRAKTRLYAFLNISSIGMISPAVGENEDMRWLDTELAAKTLEASRDSLLGIKVRISRRLIASNGLEPLFRARAAATATHTPLVVHPSDPDGTLKDVLAVLQPGDVYTHCFHGSEGGLLDEQGRVRPEAWEATERGVRFDVGHGRGSFSFPVAERALEQGFMPFSISSDLHFYNINGVVRDQATTLSKFLLLGMSLPEVVRLTTTNPARVLGKEGTIGTLRVGAQGDITISELVEGHFEFQDSKGNIRTGRERLVPRATIHGGRLYRAGRVRPCLQEM